MLFAALLFFAGPCRAADYAAFRASLAEGYAARARSELARARGYLEDLQELGLSPHGFDAPVELALLHQDLAEAYLTTGVAAFEVIPAPAPEGWTDPAGRLERARALLARRAPDLAKALTDVPVGFGPLRGSALAWRDSASGSITLRGFYAINSTGPEVLAAMLAHEAVHVRQAGMARRPAKLEAELEAYERQAQLWALLRSSAPAEPDDLAALARAYGEGREIFKAYVEVQLKAEPHWLWVEAPARVPRAAAPGLEALERQARAQGARDATAAAQEVRTLRLESGGLRSNLASAAAASLRGAAEVLGQLTELAAPHPKIVNGSIMEARALSGPAYPSAMWAAFGAAHPALSELELARQALGLRALSDRQLRVIERYNRTRPLVFVKEPFPAEALGRAVSADGDSRLAKLLSGAGAAPSFGPDPEAQREHPGLVLVPGRRFWRDPRPELAAVWTTHVLIHREQGLKDGERPSLDQEVEAVGRSLAVWDALGLDAEAKGEHPGRFLVERAAAERGPEALRLYLQTENKN